MWVGCGPFGSNPIVSKTFLTCSADDEVLQSDPRVDQCDMETSSEMGEVEKGGMEEATAVKATEDEDNGGSKEKKQRMGFRCDLNLKNSFDYFLQQKRVTALLPSDFLDWASVP